MADQLAVINDSKMVPFISHNNHCLVTHDDRILIISSTQTVRFTDATSDGKTKTWLKRPVRHVRRMR